MIGTEKNSPKAVFLNCAANLFDGGADVVGSNHCDAVHALRRSPGEVIQPIVVGAGDGRGEVRIEAIDAQDT